jgi:hypothetical protein
MKNGTAVLEREREVDVVHGANSVRTRLQPGMVVHSLRMNLTATLGAIPKDTPALIDGKLVGDDVEVPRNASTVEFLRQSGEKG